MPRVAIMRVIVVGVTTAILLVGCSDDEGQPGAAPTSSAAASTSAASSPSAPPPAAVAAADRALDQYRRFRQAYTEAGATADPQNAELLGYLEAPVKQRVVAFLLQMQQKGLVYKGTPTSDAKVTKVNLTAKPPTVIIEDCFDATNYLLVYKKTGKQAPIPSGSRRYILQTTATDFGGERGWLLTRSESFPERSC